MIKFAKYAERYLAGVQYRFNRCFDLSVILIRLVHAAVLNRLRPEPAIRLAEAGGFKVNLFKNTAGIK